MPYLNKIRKAFIDLNPKKTFEPGDWNWLFTLVIIAVWSKTPRYKTIHYLRKACFYNSTIIPEIYSVEQRLKEINIDPTDIKVAKELAFNEFMRRIGNNYEDKKIEANGDVYPMSPLEYLGTPQTGLFTKPKKGKK